VVGEEGVRVSKKKRNKQKRNLHKDLVNCVVCKRLYRVNKGGYAAYCSTPCKSSYEATPEYLEKLQTKVNAPKAKTKEPKSNKKYQNRRCEARTGSFYESREWLELRYRVLKKYGRTCMLCGHKNGRIHVDHIKPRSKYPQLALVESNLQVLCEACNLGKSNKDETDWRPASIFKELFKDLF
jgi:5-methylcytosine-specific restriction endonuclease McrA